MNKALNQAIKLAGSQTSLARMLNVKPQTVQHWSKIGIVPPVRAVQIESVLEGRVTRSMLRPDLFIGCMAQSVETPIETDGRS